MGRSCEEQAPRGKAGAERNGGGELLRAHPSPTCRRRHIHTPPVHTHPPHTTHTHDNHKQYPDEFVRKAAATLVREVCKHTPELAQLIVAGGGVGALVE